MLHWGLECTKSRIVFEGKAAVLILSFYKLLIVLFEEDLFGKDMNVWGGDLFYTIVSWYKFEVDSYCGFWGL